MWATSPHRHGAERARSLYQAYDDAVDTVERIVREQQIACDFRRYGKIKLAAKPAHYEKLARSFDLLHGHVDPETELIPAARIRDEVGRTHSMADCCIARARRCIWAASGRASPTPPSATGRGLPGRAGHGIAAPGLRGRASRHDATRDSDR